MNRNSYDNINYIPLNLVSHLNAEVFSICKFYRLFEYVNLFLKVAVHDGPLAEPLVGPLVGILLREIFSGGPSITLKIKEEQIIHMMQLVFKKEDCDTPSSTELLMEARCAISLALQELVKVTVATYSYNNTLYCIVRKSCMLTVLLVPTVMCQAQGIYFVSSLHQTLNLT